MVKMGNETVVNESRPLELQRYQLATSMSFDELVEWHNTGRPPCDTMDMFYFGVTFKQQQQVPDNTNFKQKFITKRGIDPFYENCSFYDWGPCGDTPGDHELTVVFSRYYSERFLEVHRNNPRKVVPCDVLNREDLFQVLERIESCSNLYSWPEYGLHLYCGEYCDEDIPMSIFPSLLRVSKIVVASNEVLEQVVNLIGNSQMFVEGLTKPEIYFDTQREGERIFQMGCKL